MKVRIEKVVPGGLGLGRTAEGIVFVPGVLPGELVRIHPVSRKKDFIQAKLGEVLEAAPGRTDPPCRYYGACGGCDFQFASYRTQVEVKQDLLYDALQRIGGVAGVNVEILPSNPWGYRRRARFHKNLQGKTGFLKHGSHEVLPLESCPVLHRDLEQLLINDPAAIDASASLFAGDEGIGSAGKQTTVTLSDSRGSIHRFALDGDVFFQSNTDALAPILDMLCEDAGGDTAVDLYSGVGTFAAFLCDRFSRVTAVERDRRCLKFARQNLPSNSAVCTRSVESWSRGVPREPIDRLVIDPPRTGIDKRSLKAMLSAAPREIVYVSCNPATFARDLKIMCSSGYGISHIIGVDLYPQTFHLECAARLSLII